MTPPYSVFPFNATFGKQKGDRQGKVEDPKLSANVDKAKLFHGCMFDIFLYSVEKANHGLNFASKFFFSFWHISPVLGLAVVCMPGNHEYNSKNLFDLDCSDSHAIYDRDNLWYLRCCDQQLNYKGLIIMPILQSCCGVSSFLSDLQRIIIFFLKSLIWSF